MGDILKRLKQIQDSSQNAALTDVAYDTWVNYTPVDQGNARSKTKKLSNAIHADYPYALRLDRGWSKQFGGQGMSKPTLEALKNYIKNNFKKR